jgi:hypothetical protein
VDADFYLNQIRQPLLASGMLTDEIEVIVTTRGLPLRIDTGLAGGNVGKYSSLESELTRVDSIDSVTKMQDQSWILADFGSSNILPANPYYLGKSVLGDSKKPLAGFNRASYEGMRLASRLDGFQVAEVTAAIDRAAAPVYAVTWQNYLMIDDDPAAAATDLTMMETLYGETVPKHYADSYPAYPGYDTQGAGYENTTTSVLDHAKSLIGYVGHGTAAGLASSTPGALDSTGYLLTELQFDYADGAIFHTYESFNAYTFNASTLGGQVSQGQVAQWIAAGGTAALGHVQEPTAGFTNVTNEDIVFDMMLSGYTFAEAAWAATRQLSYVNTVVGDPLLRWQPWLVGDTDLNEAVEFHDFFTLQGHWLEGGNYRQGDFNNDGTIDTEDFILFQNNWLATTSSVPAPLQDAITVTPMLDPGAGIPTLQASRANEANFDGDIDVDSEDLAIWSASYGIDAAADADGDGDSDGMDFLAWQRNFAPYDLTADFNLDVEVDRDDLKIWQHSYGSNRGGDADDDGVTTGSDFLRWQREFTGGGGALVSSVTQVPEPSAWLLLLGGVFPLGAAGRARSRATTASAR